MYQGSTIIDAEEVFSGFSEPGRLDDCKPGCETYWKWPKEIGAGNFSIHSRGGSKKLAAC